jgi:hypothetical protein
MTGTAGVKGHWYSPIAHSGTLGESQKRSCAQTQWSAGETCASPVPMSLTWGC